MQSVITHPTHLRCLYPGIAAVRSARTPDALILGQIISTKPSKPGERTIGTIGSAVMLLYDYAIHYCLVTSLLFLDVGLVQG